MEDLDEAKDVLGIEPITSLTEVTTSEMIEDIPTEIIVLEMDIAMTTLYYRLVGMQKLYLIVWVNLLRLTVR